MLGPKVKTFHISFLSFDLLVWSGSIMATEDRSHIPMTKSAAPKHHSVVTRSSKKIIPKTAERVKFEAVESAVPTTLPLSPIPSTNELIMIAFVPIMRSRHIPRETSASFGQIHELMYSACEEHWL
mmetsp:Transcript_26749/g.63428  ORF Transcript_26749/g.63428 Transcript_26749/m.63428 type:complete len:126 (-) Transcript_26749:310-687(-)